MTGQRTRILYVQPNSEVGGSDLALLRLVAALDLAAYEPIVVLPKDGPMVRRLEAAGARVCFVPMLQLRTLPSLSYQIRYLGSFWFTVARLARLIRRERIALVHSNSLYALYGAFAAAVTRRRHVWHIREIPPRVPVARAALGQLVLRLSALTVVMSEACVRGLFAGSHPRKIRRLSEGLDLAVWSRRPGLRPIRSELGLAPDTPVVGFVARLDPWKGLDVYLDAAAMVAKRIPDAVFLVSGDAPDGFESYRDDMKARAARLGLDGRVHFLGWRYRMDVIPDLMASLDVFCHTSVQPEPFGLVLIEAMAMGCPVISVSAGGPLEIIENGISGLLVSPGQAGALADAICMVLSDAGYRNRLAAAGRCRVEQHYSKSAFSRELDAVYATVLGDQPA